MILSCSLEMALLGPTIKIQHVSSLNSSQPFQDLMFEQSLHIYDVVHFQNSVFVCMMPGIQRNFGPIRFYLQFIALRSFASKFLRFMSTS